MLEHHMNIDPLIRWMNANPEREFSMSSDGELLSLILQDNHRELERQVPIDHITTSPNTVINRLLRDWKAGRSDPC